MSNGLKIEVAENGFVVHEGHEGHYERAVIGRMWAFETAKSLAEFVDTWGEGKTKVNPNPKFETAIKS